jgi:small-conductance mechanosensitive channel
VVLWLAARWLRGVVQAEMSRRRVRPEVVQVISRATFIAVIVIGLLVGIPAYFGQASLGASGILAATVLAALGVQDILRNYVSGVYLLTERRLNVGDQVEFGTYKGTIIEFRFRVAYLRGGEGELIIVPNSELFNNTVVVRANQVAGDADRPPVKGEAPAPTRKRRA